MTRVAVLLTTVLVVQGCATTQRADGSDADPLEPLNRKVFAFNQSLDRAVLKPVAKTYRDVLPEFLRDRIRAFVDNLHEPLVFANDALQGRGKAASTTALRFFVNSTVGVLGLFDRASGIDLPKQSGDFGQTLYFWGAGEGPYLVLPVFGPSNLRDAAGLGVDIFGSPVSRIGSYQGQDTAAFSVGAVDGVDQRARNIESLERLEDASLDFYSFLKSVAQQYRRTKLRESRGEAAEDDLVDPARPVR